MTKFLAPQAACLALAAALTLALFAGTDALAGHQFRVAAAAQDAAQPVALDVQHVVVIGHRVLPA